LKFSLLTLLLVVTAFAVVFAFVRLSPLLATVGLVVACVLAGFLALIGGAIGRIVSGSRRGWLTGAAYGINCAILVAGYGTFIAGLILSMVIPIDGAVAGYMAISLGVLGVVFGGWIGGRAVHR
jgi:hypothetical protein